MIFLENYITDWEVDNTKPFQEFIGAMAFRQVDGALSVDRDLQKTLYISSTINIPNTINFRAYGLTIKPFNNQFTDDFIFSEMQDTKKKAIETKIFNLCIADFQQNENLLVYKKYSENLHNPFENLHVLNSTFKHMGIIQGYTSKFYKAKNNNIYATTGDREIIKPLNYDNYKDNDDYISDLQHKVDEIITHLNRLIK